VKVDRALALVLTIAGELQIAAGGIAGEERLGPALLTAVLGLAVAYRRAYPTLAGTGAGIAMGLSIAIRGDPQVISNAIAYLCALYGLAVWSPPRRFALGIPRSWSPISSQARCTVSARCGRSARWW